MKKRVIKAVTAGALVLLITAVVLGAVVNKNTNSSTANKAKTAAAAKDSGVKEVASTQEKVTKSITADGTVDFNKKVKHFVTEEGKKIKKVYVKTGDSVRKGEKLVEYDGLRLDTLNDSLKDEKLNLESLELALEKLTIKDNVKIMQLKNEILSVEQQIQEIKNTISNNENQIEQINASIKTTETTLKQNRELFAKGFASRSDITNQEDKITEYKNSITKLKSENENLKLNIINKENTKKVDNEQLALETDKSKDPDIEYQVKAKKQEIARSRLKIEQIERNIGNFKKFTEAEISGIVTALSAEEGQSAANGAELLTIADNRDIIITSNISEYDINSISIGDKAVITGDALTKEYDAYVSRINPIGALDSSGNTVVPIELSFKGLDKPVRNNYKVSIKITKQQNNKSTLVPVTSIIRDSAGKSYVMVQDTVTKKVAKTEITTGVIKGTNVEVIELKSTDKIVEVTAAAKTNGKTNKTLLQNLPMAGGGPPDGGPGGMPPSGGPPSGGGR